MQNFCLVSMGLGKPSSGTDRDKSVYDDALFTNVVLPLIPRATLALKVPAGVFKVQNLVEIFEISAKRPDYVHSHLSDKAKNPEEGLLYHRFDTGGDVHDIGLQEWEKLREVEKGESSVIMDEGKQKVEKCVRDLLYPAVTQGTFTFLWS